MADITFKIVCYRLGEAYSNMADKWDKFLEWYEVFSWRRVDILDMLFLGWLLAAFVVVGAINVYLRFFGRGKGRPGGVLLGAGPTTSGTAGETCQWLNSVLSWLFVHCDHTPDFIDAWMRGLNEQARKNTLTDYQVKFDRVQAGSLPPRITAVLTQAGTDTITICSQLETSDVTLLVSVLQQSGAIVKVTNYDVHLQHLRGELKVFANYRGDQIDVQANFNTPPELRLRVTPRNEAHVSPQQIELAVRKAINEARTNFTISPRGGYGPLTPIPSGDNQISVGGSKPFSLRDRRLLVKVMKANSLGQRDFDVGEPYCLMLLDQPQQRHTTSVVKNSSNPFWNEHYVFELDDNSRQLRFEVYDRVKAAGEDLLGRAAVSVQDLRRMPSTRQIIPLTGKPGSQGTITVEFLFMEPGEVQNLQLSNMNADVDPMSPRRQVETSRRVMPGGTIVTTTTTTTEKPKDIRLDSSFQEPQRIQKTDMGYGTDYSPYSQRSPNFLAAHESASNASSQVVDSQGRHLQGPQLMVTSPYDSVPIGTTQAQQTVSAEVKKGNKSPLMSLFRKNPTTTVTTTTQTTTNRTTPMAGNRNSMPIESYIIQQPQQNAPLEGAYSSEPEMGTTESFNLKPKKSPVFGRFRKSKPIKKDKQPVLGAQSYGTQSYGTQSYGQNLPPQKSPVAGRFRKASPMRTSSDTSYMNQPTTMSQQQAQQQQLGQKQLGQQQLGTGQQQLGQQQLGTGQQQLGQQQLGMNQQQPYGQQHLQSSYTQQQQQSNKPFVSRFRKPPLGERVIALEDAEYEQSIASEYSGYDQTHSLVDPREGKKSKSFASALRKRFSRGPKKPRSHSADRAGSLRQDNLLKPPEQGARTTDYLTY